MGLRNGLAWFCRRFWYAPDVVAAVFVLLYMTFLNATPTDYIGGLHNDGAWTFAVSLGYGCGLMPIALICTVVVAVRMEVSWPRHIHTSGRLLLWRLLVGGVLGASVILFFLPLRPGGYVVYTYGFREYVRNNVDIPAIRTWLSIVDPNACTGERVHLKEARESKNVRWPEAILTLNPDILRLRLDSGNHPMTRLAWIGFDAAWGVTIGREEMPVPPTMPPHKVEVGSRILYKDGEYRLPVGPGVYVWHRSQ